MHRRAGGRISSYVNMSSELGGPLIDRQQADPGRSGVGNPDPVVADLNGEVGPSDHSHCAGPGSSVPVDVGQRFVNDAVGRDLDGGWQGGQVAFEDDGGYRRSAGQGGLADGADQAELVKA